jgi:hypothetical protein
MIVPGMPVADQTRPEASVAGPNPPDDVPAAGLVDNIDLNALALRGAAKGLRGGRAVRLIGLRGGDAVYRDSLPGPGPVLHDDLVAAFDRDAVHDVVGPGQVAHGTVWRGFESQLQLENDVRSRIDLDKPVLAGQEVVAIPDPICTNAIKPA